MNQYYWTTTDACKELSDAIIPAAALHSRVLSFNAKGTLALVYIILAEPGKNCVSVRDVRALSPTDSAYAVRKAFGELVSAGFLKRENYCSKLAVPGGDEHAS